MLDILATALTILFAASKIFGHFPYHWWIVFAPCLVWLIIRFIIVLGGSK